MSALKFAPRWASSNLLECADFVRGVTYTKNDAQAEAGKGLVPLLRANNLQSGKFDFNELVYVPDAVVSAHQILNNGDVVIATSSGSLSVVGKASQYFREEKISFGAFCGVLRPHDLINKKYFGHFFLSQAYRTSVSELARGVNINNLKRDHFGEINFPVAPLNEQRRIADKLDTVLTRVDALNDRLARITPLLKRFRQSVLAAATSGRLTEDWRAEMQLTAAWPLVSLGEVAKDFSYGSAAKSSKVGDVPVLRMGNIQNGSLDWEDLVYTSDEVEINKYRLCIGDVLFNRTNSPDLVGKTAVFKGEREAVYAGYLIRVKCSEKLNSDFLNYCLGSPAGRDYCWKVKSDGVSQSNINAKKLAAFEFELPSMAEQTEIVRRVEILFAYADRLEARLQTARNAADRLTPALLAKAFRGELVPQDPNDEPATELLRRLREARAAEAPAKKTRGRKAAAVQGAESEAAKRSDPGAG